MNMKSIISYILIFLLTFTSLAYGEIFSDANFSDMILQPKYFTAFYNEIIKKALNDSGTWTQEKEELWSLKHSKEIPGMCISYTNGYGNISADFYYDENGQINMLIANAYPTDNITRETSITQLIMKNLPARYTRNMDFLTMWRSKLSLFFY